MQEKSKRIVKKPKHVKLLPFMEVLTSKIDPITKERVFKVRLAARGDLLNNKENYYSPVPNLTEQRLFIQMCISKNLLMKQGDISSAYLYSRLKEPVYFKLPTGHPVAMFPEVYEKMKKDHGLEDDECLCYESMAAMYGLPESAQTWERYVKEYIKSKSFKDSKNSPGIFWRDQNGDIIYIIIYVDDFIYACSKRKTLEDFEKVIEEKFKIKFSEDMENS